MPLPYLRLNIISLPRYRLASVEDLAALILLRLARFLDLEANELTISLLIFTVLLCLLACFSVSFDEHQPIYSCKNIKSSIITLLRNLVNCYSNPLVYLSENELDNHSSEPIIMVFCECN